MFMNVPLMTGTGVSYSLRILASKGNPASSFQAGGIGNMLSALDG